MVPRVMPRIAPRAAGSQSGAPSPVRAGTKTTPPESGTRARQRLGLRRGADDAEPVAQPLHRRPGHEDRALEGVGQLAGRRLPRDGREQTGVAAYDVRAGVDEHERPGAVGALGLARREAGLAEQRRLLVARDARRPAGRARGTRRATSGRPRPHDATTSGSAARGTRQQLAQLVAPAALADVVEQGARRVGRVGHVPGAAGQPGDEVGVDGADGRRAVGDAGPRASGRARCSQVSLVPVK